MRRSLAIALLLAICAAARASWVQAADTPGPLTLQQYIQTLDDLLVAVHRLQGAPQSAGELLRALPSMWQVEADGQSFEISTETIRRGLWSWQKKPASASLERVLQRLDTLRYEAVQWEAPAPDSSSRRALLNKILAGNEFRNVHGQTWIDRLKERLTELLIRLLGRAFASSAIPTIGNIVVYGLMAIALLVLAYWLYRSLRDSARLETIMPVPVPVSAKEWPVWISEARRAADRGEWRDAIHLAYWGGISFLEAQGAWRPDVARTPREYLRLLSAASTQHPALRTLTTRLEAIWYGMRSADADGFQQSLADLERLGCPCN